LNVAADLVSQRGDFLQICTLTAYGIIANMPYTDSNMVWHKCTGESKTPKQLKMII
jgi:hypothetical protein